jgi:hypothetical protein
MTEELGSAVQYQIDQNPKSTSDTSELKSTSMNKCAYLRSVMRHNIAVKLPEYMNRFEWVDITSFKPEGYFRGGWLKGV